jgi:hypothetical protein
MDSSVASTPRKIAVGFATIVGISLLLGGLAMRQIVGINRNVAQLATNSVPSVVTLNKIIRSNADTVRALPGRGNWRSRRRERPETASVPNTRHCSPTPRTPGSSARPSRREWPTSPRRIG